MTNRLLYAWCIFLACLCSVSGSFAQQAQDQLVHLHKAEQLSPGGLFDTVFDRAGHKYTLAQIAIDKPGSTPGTKVVTSCAPGYFSLYLEAGCGMDDNTNPAHNARLAVLCQVLTDIADFIPSPCTASGQKINIWVRAAPSGSAFLAEATPFFSLPYSAGASGIADNMIWTTLNSGKDAWTNTINPLFSSGSYGSFYHGSVAFQFDGSINWHTDLATPPPAGYYDLYTAALHELLHALGFYSLINYNGSSVLGTGFNYYSRYDQHLQTAGGTPLLTNSGSCSLYGYRFNAALTPSVVLSPGSTIYSCPAGYQTGGISNHTACADAVRYVSGTMSAPVYTPSCFEKGSSLSHFEDECTVPTGFPLAPPASNDHYYAMSNQSLAGPYDPAANPGAMKRYPTGEERQVLCNIGYAVNSTYGNAANLNLKTYTGGVCTGLQVAGINDGIAAGAYSYVSTGGSPITISEGSLLKNDYKAVRATCMEVVHGKGTVTTGSSSFTYTPGVGEYGVVLLRYTPQSTTGSFGNITYIYLFVSSANCTPTACNLLPNGSFEDVDAGACGDMNATPGMVHCWDVYCASTDLFATDCSIGSGYSIPVTATATPTHVHPLSDPANKHFIDLQASNANAGPDWAEGMQAGLSTSLTDGQEYVISCWAKTAHIPGDAFFPFIENHLEFAVSSSFGPLAYLGDRIPSLPPGLNLVWDLVLPTAYGDDWHYFEQKFTYHGTDGNRLAVFNAPYLNNQIAPYAVVNYVDDINIQTPGAACTFLPPSVCNGTVAFINLADAVSIPGGTFSWPTTPVISGIPAIAHSDTLDVAAATIASATIGGNGLVPVAYTYINALGCSHTVHANIYLLSSPPPAITGITTIPAGTTTLLENPAHGGRWSSSNTAIAIINPTTGVVTGINTGTATIAYTVGADCTANTMVTITTGTETIQQTRESTFFFITPNPSRGTFTVRGTLPGVATEQSVSIELVDMPGKVLISDIAIATNGTVNKTITADSNLPNGLYLIRIKNDYINQVIRFALSR